MLNQFKAPTGRQGKNLVGKFSQAALSAWHLEAIGGFRTDGFFNIRGIRDGRAPINEFYPLADIDGTLARVAKVAETHNAYVRVTPCDRKDGSAASAMDATVLTLDCDNAAASEVAFALDPNFALASGSTGASHLTWLTKPNDDLPKWARRVAASVGADMRATDAARLFRVGGTFNYKHSPPRAVDYFYFNLTGAERSVEELFGHLPEIDNVNKLPTTGEQGTTIDSSDPLRSIPSTDYVPALTGRQINGGGFVQCPFHSGGNERGPSLKCWSDPANGFQCFGRCDAPTGGDIFTFAAKLYRLDSHRDFPEIRRRLAADLLAVAEVAA